MKPYITESVKNMLELMKFFIIFYKHMLFSVSPINALISELRNYS